MSISPLWHFGLSKDKTNKNHKNKASNCDLPVKFLDTSIVVRMAPCKAIRAVKLSEYHFIHWACVRTFTFSFLLALNLRRHSTVSWRCIMEATVERCCGKGVRMPHHYTRTTEMKVLKTFLRPLPSNCGPFISSIWLLYIAKSLKKFCQVHCRSKWSMLKALELGSCVWNDI